MALSAAVRSSARRRPSAHARIVARREPFAPRAGRRARASRRGARCRCSARTGSASAPPRGRRASGRPRRPELRTQVDRQVRHPLAVRELARAPHRLRRAARELAVVLGVRPQLERHPDRLLARSAATAAPPPRCRRRRSSPRACARGRGASAHCARRGAERPVKRVRGELGRVALARREAAELLGDLVARRSAPRRAALAPRIRHTAALPAAIVAPQPLASKPASRDPPFGLAAASSASEILIRSPHAAPPAAPVWAPAGVCAAPAGRSRWSLAARRSASPSESRARAAAAELSQDWRASSIACIARTCPSGRSARSPCRSWPTIGSSACRRSARPA